MSYGYPPPPGRQPPEWGPQSSQPPQQPPGWGPAGPQSPRQPPYPQWQQPAPGWGAPLPPRKSRTGLIVTLSVVGGLLFVGLLGGLIALVASAGGSSSHSSGSGSAAPAGSEAADDSGEQPAAGQPTGAQATDEAAADVKVTSCEVDSLTEWPSADVEVVNHGAKAASYVVNVEFLDGDGTRLAEGLAASTSLDPGQKAVEKAQGLSKIPGKLTCKVFKVTRYPAS